MAEILTSLDEVIREWVLGHHDITALIAVAVVVAAGYVWMNWGKLSSLPAISHLFVRRYRWRDPKAVPERYSFMVARIGNDTNNEHQPLIIQALQKFEGIQVLPLDRTIVRVGLVPEDAKGRGHETARRYLKESQASVLIWGMVPRRGETSLPKIYWTTSHMERRMPACHYPPTIEGPFILPEVFWSDLAKILRLLVVSDAAKFRAAVGRYVADRLPPFITRVRTLLASIEDIPGWDAAARGRTRLILADVLNVFGHQKGRNALLEEAVATYKEALKEWNMERAPLRWAATQNNLGTALSRLGEREKGTARLEEALAAYKKVLEVFEAAQATCYVEGTARNLWRVERMIEERRRAGENVR